MMPNGDEERAASWEAKGEAVRGAAASMALGAKAEFERCRAVESPSEEFIVLVLLDGCPLEAKEVAPSLTPPAG